MRFIPAGRLRDCRTGPRAECCRIRYGMRAYYDVVYLTRPKHAKGNKPAAVLNTLSRKAGITPHNSALYTPAPPLAA